MNLEKPFFQNLPPGLLIGKDAAQQRLFREYGAVFVARGGVTPPTRIVYADEADVRRFQDRLDIKSAKIGDFELELQATAMDALLAAIDEANRANLSITPRGADSARRNYDDTVELWRSRVEPALVHWCAEGRITGEAADSIRRLSPFEQVAKVFELEEKGIFFAKDLSKSIIYSVAPPGSSQHLSLLAFDVAEFETSAVRQILARHYWYQTVVSDLPHFTFLGCGTGRLRELGLKRLESSGREFWIPDL
ncbi:MAG TPA: hypothetical protein VFZ23_09790 [Pyrinomonadaceae bacterium]